MADAKNITHRIWDLMESNQIDRFDELVSEDVHFKMPGLEMNGLGAFKDLIRAYLAAFPDLKHRAIAEVAAGDAVAREIRVTGTHTGTMVTPQGNIPATGREVVWESCDYVRVRGGKIVSWHVYHDSVPFLTAMGLMPTAP